VVASASNDHRLGANEAPPAIMSVFLGDQLTAVFDQIRKGETQSSKAKGTLTIGADVLPPLPKDAGDRNRTSPFAFTGNRFEFRAVGSGQSIAGPLCALNTMVADSLDYVATRLEAATGGDPAKLDAAVQALLKELANEHWAVIFNGDNYSEEWHKEAERRGLANLRTAVDALPALIDPAVVEMFEKHQVLSKRELHSRFEIYLEQYVKTVSLEASLSVKIGKTQIFPALIRHQNDLASTCASLKAVGYTFDTDTLDKVTALVKELQDSLTALESSLAHRGGGVEDEARYARDVLLPRMRAVRAAADAAEGMVADDLWPLPTYMEMLFIK
jgi:glutamine synthetase